MVLLAFSTKRKPVAAAAALVWFAAAAAVFLRHRHRLGTSKPNHETFAHRQGHPAEIKTAKK